MIYKLEEICYMQSGGTPKRGEPLFYGGDIPWVTIADFGKAKNGVLYDTEENITELGLKSINNRFFKKGTLLLAMYGSVGKVAIAGKDVSTNQAILGINPKDEKLLNIQYLKYWFVFNKAYLYSQGKGATLHNISLTIVKKQKIDLPSLQNQNKIVTILDYASSLIEKREQCIYLFDELLKASFLDMFGDPVFNKKEWEKIKLNKIISKIDAGWSPVCEEKSRVHSTQFAILKQGAVSRRFFDPNQNKLLPENLPIKKMVLTNKGDLLFSRKNSSDFVGSTVYIFDDYENLLLPDTIFSLRYNPSKATGIYLFYLFNDPNFRKIIQGLSNGAAASMPNISQEKLLDLELPIPNIELQSKFDDIVLVINEKRKKINSSLLELNGLFRSTLQKAFNGDLNFNIDVELDALLKEENSNGIKSDKVYLQRLVDRLNGQEFENKETYDTAKSILFQLLKEGSVVTQEYNETLKSIHLVS
jgi:type I restriction enzyme, S subunit